MKLVIQAVYQWDMIRDGDRLLLGLSGGKDSLSLLHVLLEIRRRLPIKFELEVCTIDPMTPSFDPSSLIPYVESLGLKYHYLRDDIVARAGSSGSGGHEVSSLCSFCARMKRGKLYTCARENNCNTLVLAQHLDDCAESFMMSVMHNGFLRTMQANYKINAGDLNVIRPLIYCRERLMTGFAKSANLPVINENCPACFEEPKERARVKKLLSREESLYPNFFENIKRSLIPLMHADSTAILRSYLDETLAKSKSDDPRKRKRRYGDVDGSLDGATVGVPYATDGGLKDASDEDLLREIALRRADKYRLAGASKFIANDDAESSGPVCSRGGVCTIAD
jgi:tRNA(Ile)-lysidine synthase TilS/MesJ